VRTCHVQVYGFSDFRRFSEGIDGIKGNRNAPSIVNPAGWARPSGTAAPRPGGAGEGTGPQPDRDAPGLAEAIERLERHADYPDSSARPSGQPDHRRPRGQGIAQFERTFVSFNTKYDRVRRGEAAFTPEEEAGRRIFNTEIGDCFHCHAEPLFTTSTFHNTASIPWWMTAALRRHRQSADMGKFKAPSLRNIFDSVPYMHDGRFTDLHESSALQPRIPRWPNVDPLIRRACPAPMRPGEIDTLITYLETLTDPDYLTNPALSNPYRP